MQSRSHSRNLQLRFASPEDAALIAPMNRQLIADEGHRNSMDILQLGKRMRDWLQGEYKAVIFEQDDIPIGYALFKREDEFVYLRQLFVSPENRRQGIARYALQWLWGNAWTNDRHIRIDVLVGNGGARAFWHSVGFSEYCVTMEAARPDDQEL